MLLGSVSVYEYLLDLLTMTMQAPVMAYFTGKAIKTRRLGLCILVYTIMVALEYMAFRTKPQYSWIVLLVLSLAIFMAFSEVKKSYTVFYYIMGIVLMMFFETLFELIRHAIVPEMDVLLMTDSTVIAGMRLVMQPLLIIVWHLNTRICSRVFHMGESKELNRYVPFIFIEAVALYVMYMNMITTELEKRFFPEMLLFIAIAAFLLIDLLLIRTFRKMDQFYKNEIEERTAREVLQVQMESNQYQNEKNREFRRIRHDLVNQLQTIQLFLDEMEIDRAKDIIRNYSKELKLAGKTTITGNEFADMVINKKQYRADEAGITLKLEGWLANNLDINPAAFSSLIENILDNAINGCINSKKKEPVIEFKIAADRNKLMIRCTNTCADNSVIPAGSKRERGDHGWGTQIIEEIAAHYGGTADYQIINGCFVVNVYCFLGQEKDD